MNAAKDLIVRDATEADMAFVQAIYAHHVLEGLASFETEAPDLQEMSRRRLEVLDRGLPYRVAILDGKVCGFAYANFFRPRAAYRHTVEDSIYVDPAFVGRKVGSTLLHDLIERCTELGYRQMIAVIGDSGNAASIGLHKHLGFEITGHLKSTGFKLGRWVDTMLMQRPLGDGDKSLPKQ